MAEHVWTVLCNSVSIDRETNTISLFEVLEELGFEALPLPGTATTDKPEAVRVCPFHMVLVSLWERSNQDEGEECVYRAELKAPAGRKAVMSREVSVDMTTHPRTRSILRIAGASPPPPGRYLWEVRLKTTARTGRERWVKVAGIPFVIKDTPTTPAPQGR